MTSSSESKSGTKTFSDKWTEAVDAIHAPVLVGLQKLTRAAAVHPKRTIGLVVTLSLGLFVVGLFTGFSVDVDEDVLWTPKNSYPVNHMNWINDESGFPGSPRNFVMIFHNDGAQDILGRAQVGRIFEALDAVRGLDDYTSVCQRSDLGDCRIRGVTKFWNSSSSVFNELTATDEDTLAQMSVGVFPNDGTPAFDNNIFGNAVRDSETNVLVNAQNYMVTIELPEDDEDELTESFEELAMDAIFELRDEWADDGFLQVEVFAERSFPDEFERAIISDIPLVPIVFILMGLFTSLIFWKRNPVESRSLLGFTAVLSVLLSILAGYGLMFVCAVPFTSMTQILPFVFFGVGLDDAFIITGSFFRKNRETDIVERVGETIDDIGISIFVTTMTSSLAFGFGCLSSVPAVFWLCVYAVPTIVFILLWQLTFFIACLVLDERRCESNNRDCLRCCSQRDETSRPDTESSLDRFMGLYAEKLLQTKVKAFVILSFAAILAACSVSTSNLKQAFEFTDVLPSDSYITPFFDAFDYSTRSSVAPTIYFRNVDQSDPEIQVQMLQYVSDLTKIDAVLEPPESFWLRDFQAFVNSTESAADLTFVEQVDAFLSEDVFRELYDEDIVRSSNGEIVTSRCTLAMDNVDIEDVNEQIKALRDQQDVSESQPVNKGLSELSFFTYEPNYNIWEFYAVSAEEIALTTITGVCAVTGIALLLLPHWSAALFVAPLISILYIDLLGVMQWAGVSVNPVSYITLVMSIGLLVDFILHVLLRYYEAPGKDRHEKTVDMMKTMGSSILIGGITTFLGTVPLAFSTSDIFNTVFIAFLGLVTLGALHGLVLLPVLLSILGPTGQRHVNGKTEAVTEAPLPEPARVSEKEQVAVKATLSEVSA